MKESFGSLVDCVEKFTVQGDDGEEIKSIDGVEPKKLESIAGEFKSIY